MAKLAEQIDSHVDVISMDSPTTNADPEGQSNPKVDLRPTLPAFRKDSLSTLAVAQGLVL